MNWPLRKALMGLTAVSIVAAIGIIAFVIHFRELKVRKFAVCWRVVSLVLTLWVFTKSAHALTRAQR